MIQNMVRQLNNPQPVAAQRHEQRMQMEHLIADAGIDADDLDEEEFEVKPAIARVSQIFEVQSDIRKKKRDICRKKTGDLQ